VKLNPADVRSVLWQKLDDHLNERIAALQRQLEADADLIKTTRLRGRIEAYRELLALAKPATTDQP
jgi:uncharacterized protein YaaR (DUF327 family)